MEINAHTSMVGLFDLLMDAVFAVDASGRVVFASAACERIFGYTPQELIGQTMFDLILPEDRERTRQSANEVMAGHPQLHFENRYVRKDGKIAHIMWATRWSPADQLRIGVARDITERKHAESMQAMVYAISEAAYAADDLLALIQSIHEIINSLLSAANFSVALYDQDTDQLSFPYHVDQYEQRPAPSKLAADSLHATIIRTGQALLCPVSEDAPPDIAATVDGPKPLCWLGVPLRSQKGTIGALLIKSYPGGVCYTERDKELLQFVSTQIAITIERQQMQARLLHMAQYDQLTDLPNRGLLYDRLKTALSSAKQEQQPLSVLYIDLDKFKQVNDTLGHGVGDQLLQAVAERLKQSIRKSDTVARIGGDEFVVLLQHAHTPKQASVVADKIRKALSSPFVLANHSLSIVPSVGIAHYPEHGEFEQELLTYADNTMYLEKKNSLLRSAAST
ncbi:diguanylate cyclase [Alcaligenaceae bacterium CGII-47]|nr:diguanylate cyclase [Alcaligenaceae bacterium CGII-47]